MTELITGAKGSAHVTSAQQGAINAYTIGTGAYILDGCAATLPSANTLHIAAGHLMVQGRAIEVTATDLTIANGTQGTKRHDLACVHYVLSEGVETTTLTVVQGTASANPVDPTVSGSILDGDSSAQISLWRVVLDGITPTVEQIADVLQNIVVASSIKTNPAYILWSSGRLETWGRTTPPNANGYISQVSVDLPRAYDMSILPVYTCGIAKTANVSEELDINACAYMESASKLMVKKQSPNGNSAYGDYPVYWRVDGVALL